MKAVLSAVLSLCIFLAARAIARAQTPPPTVDGYITAAKVAAGTDWAGTFLRMCIPPPPGTGGPPPPSRTTPARETWYAEPAKVADNFYFVGTKIHSAWALVGNQGIIIIEALFDYAAPDEILGGLKKLGLDQNRVKYVILSHAHGDHDGGARMLQDTIPGVHLIYGAEDWDAIDKAPTHMGGKPKRDITGDDGMVVSVGDASVRIVTTPGHTPGTLSYLFEIRDHGKPLRVAYVGGTAVPFNADAQYYDRYIASAKKMSKAAADYGATVLLSNHTEFDSAFFKAHAADDRKNGEANPFDVGAGAVARYFTVVEDCAAADKLRAAAAAAPSRAQNGSEANKGSWEKVTVHGKSLEGNLEGDSPDRDVFVYLPPSYKTNPNRRYPVVYFLHGYAAHAETYWNSLSVPAAADADIANGSSHEMIIVLPDAFTVYSGSMFSNSPTTGDWETFVADDLIAYIDGHYRTIADRSARGLAGHSMGGYGTVRIGMKHPEAFSVLYAMSSCCLMNDPQRLLPGAAPTRQPPSGVLAKALSAQAAAWAPDPMNPPQFFDLPTKNGEIQPLIADKWVTNSPLVMVDQYVPNLKSYRAIAIDVGTQDPFLATNTQLDQAFTRLGVTHKFETYEGTHGNRITARFAAQVLPFFSENLAAAR